MTFSKLAARGRLRSNGYPLLTEYAHRSYYVIISYCFLCPVVDLYQITSATANYIVCEPIVANSASGFETTIPPFFQGQYFLKVC